MTPMHVVFYASLTFLVFILMFLTYTWFKTRTMMKQSEKHALDLKKELKKGMKVICAGGLIGTFEEVNKDSTVATITLKDGSVVEVAYYSINSILINN